MNKPFISVMVLCYNYAHLLMKALDAIARQTFRDFEIVMINNDSTDNTEEVYRNFKESNPDISMTYVHVHPNEGPIHGWNEAFPYAKGVYILFNDADDWMEPNCLELLAKKAKESGADRVMGSYQEVMPDGTVTRVRRYPDDSPSIPSAMLQGAIFRKDIIEKNNIRIQEKPYTIAYDAWFVYNFAALEERRGVVVNEVIYNYYYNPGSITQNMSRSNQMDHDFEVGFGPHSELTASAMKKTNDIDLRNQMEYLFLRSYFSAVLTCFQKYSYTDAKKGYIRMHNKAVESLPGYWKNPLLRPFGNGYERKGSIACWIMNMLERCHAIWLIGLTASMTKNNGLLRKST